MPSTQQRPGNIKRASLRSNTASSQNAVNWLSLARKNGLTFALAVLDKNGKLVTSQSISANHVNDTGVSTRQIEKFIRAEYGPQHDTGDMRRAM